MLIQIFAIILLIFGLINGYILLFNYPADFKKSKPIHAVLTVLILFIGIFLLFM